MEELILDSGIKKIAIKNPGGELIATLRINVADARTAEKFADLINNLESIAKNKENEKKILDKKYAGRPITTEDSDDVDAEQVIERSRMNIKYLESCIEELESVFGKGVIKEIYADSYAMDPDFIPDESALVELVDKLVPVMSNLFERRFKTLQSKYNASKRGKHTKSKADLIQEYREKHE